MAEAKLRIKLKHDTEENWLKATTFKPLKGELIIYDVDSTHSVPRFKVGDGVKVVGDLPFTDKDFAKLGDINADFLSDLLVAGDGISINKKSNADKIEVKIDSSKVITATGFHAKEGTAESYLYADNLQYWDYQGNQYMLAFPSKNGTLTTDNSFKTINGNSIVGSGDIAVATLATDNTFTGTNTFQKSQSDVVSKINVDPGPVSPLISVEKKVQNSGIAITSKIEIDPENIKMTDNGVGYAISMTHDGFKVSASGIYTSYGLGTIAHNTGFSGEQTLSLPNKSGTLALTSDIPSFNNFTLLTSKPSDWATNYDTYYKKGDFGFFRNVGDSTWAANKFYSAVPAEIDIQTSAQPIKIQASGTNAWGEYGGLNLSYGKAKLYGINGEMSDTVGYIDISNGNLTSAVYNADFTLSNPVGRGYGFSVKDTSTLFSVGLNKSQAGDYAEQYYCNINAPLNVTQIHGFTQLTDQPSDWSTKYGSYYAGFDAFNGDSRFWGRSDGLYKPTNDIALNVGQDHKISLDYVGKKGGSITVNYGLDVSTNGITVRGPIKSATSLSLISTDSPIMLTKSALSSSSGLIFSVGQTNKMDAMFTISAAAANSTEEDTAVFNLARVQFKGGISTAAGYKLELPGSSGTLAHIPTGTSQNAMLFGNGTWQVPVQINGGNFKDCAGSIDGTITPISIYAPISKAKFTSNVTTQAYSFCVYRKGDTRPYFESVTDLYNSYEYKTHTRISNANEVSWTINYRLRGNFVSFTIGTTHKDGRVVMRTFNVSDFLNVINTGTWIDVSGASSNFQFRISKLGALDTTFGIKNSSYNNLTGEWFIILHYAF